MDSITEKFTIKITDQGLEIKDNHATLSFTAGEALMLLDILKTEEQRLINIAEENSPIPIKIQL